MQFDILYPAVATDSSVLKRLANLTEDQSGRYIDDLTSEESVGETG
jgi:hypothetical protein